MSGATPPIDCDDGVRLWRRIATDDADNTPSPAAVARFAGIVTAALAGYLLGDDTVDATLGAGAVANSRLSNRFNAAAQRGAVAMLAATGFDIVILKGFAFAHTLYPAPEIRTIGDLDILVRGADRDRLIASLGAQGYAFRPLPTPPWGFISTASYMPFVSADGAVNLDIHVQPDCYPAYRALTVERVFAAARTVRDGDLEFRVPDDTHALLLCGTNAAKDKFGVYAARKIVDALLLLRTGAPDLTAADALATEGGFATPWRVFLALLRALGADLAEAYDAAALPGRARGEFSRMLAETRALYPSAPGLLATLRREVTVCTEPSVGLHNAAVRLAGLVRPGSGVPQGAPPS